ncbi:hypothetical protein EPUS_09094 [Endocarpon pusillum Z07020]|uniref:Uncharacterized protein n=1 Tax=Endocarpon pusillum (strain Z07020 / HMAS-L-300199) TaxID=1263415 RepID=U1GR93_ENDPU|nr:uncharacterized protein EPUS_09094 [Endocarpon pusillum Z07020]ERF74888.1 hypothetical protein EPUS_09094 [Endocarpon pusillum Z07020]
MSTAAHARGMHSSFLPALFVTAFFILEVNAYRGNVCCRQAARLPEKRMLFNGSEPWKACSLNSTDQYPEGTTFPSVNHTMAWCQKTCPGIQTSELKQWLQPLATWFAPYVALLLLCPIGGSVLGKEGEDQGHDSSFLRTSRPRPGLLRRASRHVFLMFRDISEFLLHQIKDKVPEYGSILGDPSSALAGTFFEIHADLVGTTEKGTKIIEDAVSTKDTQRDDLQQRHIRQMIVLVGDLNHHDSLSSLNPPTKDTVDDVKKRLFDAKDNQIETAMAILVAARLNFFNGVFMPVILTLAVVASVFYEAYTKLGDNDTAHGLAFGVWFSWLLVLAVASNCFACSLNGGVVRATLTPFMGLSESRVPLRERFINSKLWLHWMEPSNVSALVNVESTLILPTSTWAKFLVGQLLGWALVALTTASAAAISYTTPTVGLGCRSFTFLLWGILALATAIVRVGANWAELQHKLSQRSVVGTALIWIYWVLTTINALVLFIGTILHLAGVFRSCRCKRLFVGGLFQVELNSNTVLAVENAKKIWLPVGYMAFGVIWIVCGLVIAARKWITAHMEKWAVEDRQSKGHTRSSDPPVDVEIVSPDKG